MANDIIDRKTAAFYRQWITV